MREKNEIVKKDATYRINKARSSLFEKTNKVDEPLARLMKKQREVNTKNIRGEYECEKITRECCE